MGQQGSLYLDHGSWYVRYWETVRNEDGTFTRKHPAHRLASVREYPKKSDVIPLKNQFMDRLNRIGLTPKAGVLLVEFVDKIFLPACEKRLSGAGVKCYRDTWKCHLKPRSTGLRLRDIRPVHLQNLLNAVEEDHGTKLAHGTYKTMKVTLSAIFTEARNLGLYYGSHPTTGVRIPKGRRHGRKRLACSLDEILKHLEIFSKEPMAVPRLSSRKRKAVNEDMYTPRINAKKICAIIGVAAFAGLRKGEIQGLWWSDVHTDILTICRSVWRSTVKDTKTGEDTDNPGLVPIIRPLCSLLDAIKPEGATGFIFPNRFGGALDLDQIAKRIIKPTLEAHGMVWKGWQAYRRGLATNLKELDVEDTTIQCILRHKSVSTTQRYYIKTTLKMTQKAMKQLEGKICPALVQRSTTC